MKKKNLKPMIISALLAVGFGATSVGTSFALFTDHADTTINVTAGKVDVSTALTVEAVSSLNSGDTGNVVANDKLSATLSQGGAVTVKNDGTVSIDRMIPGDRVVLKMANTNASNVAIKHRVTTSSASFVFDGNTKVADTSNYKLGEKLTVKFYSDPDCAAAHLVAKPGKWSNPVNPSADPISTYYIEVAFPDGDKGEIKFGNENKDNIYQNKAADFAFSLEAVQGNAVTSHPAYGFDDNYEETIGSKTYLVHEVSDLDSLKAIGTYLTGEDAPTDKYHLFRITDDIDVNGLTTPISNFRGVLEGNGHRIYNSGNTVISGEEFVGLFSTYGTKADKATTVESVLGDYDSVYVKDLTFDFIHVNATSKSAGIIFGGSARAEAGEDDGWGAKPGTVLEFDNITINSTCSIQSVRNMGALSGNCRCWETTTLKNVTNYMDVLGSTTNVGGLLGSASYVTYLTLENCKNYGNVRGTTGIGGFVGQSNSVSSQGGYRFINNILEADIYATTQVGILCGSINSNTSSDYIDSESKNNVYSAGKIYAKTTTLHDNIFIQNGILSLGTRDSLSDILLNVTVDLDVQLNQESNQFIVTPVQNAVRYECTLALCGKVIGKTGTQGIVTSNKTISSGVQTYYNVNDLKDNFGHLTMAGYVYDDTVTSFTSTPQFSTAYASNNRMNFFRVSANGTTVSTIGSNNLNKTYKLGNEYVFVANLTDTGISPVGGNVAYTINALDNDGKILASYYRNDNIGSSTPLKNMAGATFNGSVDYASTPYNEYVA